MDVTGKLYSMRGAARVIRDTDPRTVTAKVYKYDIRPRWERENSLTIDQSGLDRLIAIYDRERAMAGRKASA